MENPTETVKESRCISSCTPHSQCLCLHETQRWWPRGLKGHSERTCPPCIVPSTSSVLRTENTKTNSRQETPIAISDWSHQRKRARDPPCAALHESRGDCLSRHWLWTCWQAISLPGEGNWRKGQYPFFLAMSPLPPKPGAKVEAAALSFGSTKLLVSSLFCLHPSDHSGSVVHSAYPHMARSGHHAGGDLITTKSRTVKPGMKKSLTQCGLCIIASSWPAMGWVLFLSLQSHFLSSALCAELALNSHCRSCLEI